MAIVCRQCGRHNTDGSRFCANPECGAYLGWEGQQQTGTQPAPVLGGTPSRPVAETQSAAAALTLSDAALAVVPGEIATSTATVHNGGSQVEQFAVGVVGPAAPWSTVEPPTVTVYPGERAQCAVRFAPPRRPDTAAGRAWFTVRATSVLHPGLVVDGHGTLDVGAFRDLAAVLVPQGTSGRWRTMHAVDVANSGNVLEPVRLSASDPSGRLRIAVPEGEIPVAPGTRRINLAVRPPLRLVGRPQRYPFQVTVAPRPPAPPIRLDGGREGVPLVAGWVPKVALALAALAIAAVALVLFRPTPAKQGATTTGVVNAGVSPASHPSEAGGGGQPSATMKPSPSAAAHTSAPPSPSPSPSPSATAAAAGPKLNPEDCLPYDPNSLTLVNEGATGWLLQGNGNEAMVIFDNQTDAQTALQLVRLYNKQCFIGRGNSRPNRSSYIVRYWIGTGLPGTAPSPDCIPYDPHNLTINQISVGYQLVSGNSALLLLDNPTDAANAKVLAASYSRQCFIGRGNSRPNRLDYIMEYWLP